MYQWAGLIKTGEAGVNGIGRMTCVRLLVWFFWGRIDCFECISSGIILLNFFWEGRGGRGYVWFSFNLLEKNFFRNSWQKKKKWINKNLVSLFWKRVYLFGKKIVRSNFKRLFYFKRVIKYILDLGEFMRCVNTFFFSPAMFN